MNSLLFLVLAPLPSIIWLAFYLRKDKHPEPNKLIIKMFLLGILIVPIAGILEKQFSFFLDKTTFLNTLTITIVGFAFIEELLKYLVVKFGILKNPDFDEPVDTMIYLIVVALGFAAAENIYLLSMLRETQMSIISILEFITTRFLGATFLHALASGITGYFLAASLLISSKIRKILIAGGLICSTVLHSVFNYIIILGSSDFITETQRNIFLLVLLLGIALIISLMFRKINKFRSICKL